MQNLSMCESEFLGCNSMVELVTYLDGIHILSQAVTCVFFDLVGLLILLSLMPS